MNYREIDLKHPYFDSWDENEGVWKSSTTDQIFQPVNAEWPLYWIKVWGLPLSLIHI